MSYTVKYATYQDLPQAISVEKETLGNYTYLEDAWHYFSTQKGELICVYDNTKMVGIGRFTVLPDGSGWLETLRVIPAYQRKGVGKEIYKKYLTLANQYHCSSISMFTGITNIPSYNLAKRYGLSIANYHRGYQLSILSKGNPYHFKHVNWQRAIELICPLKNMYNNYMCFNRTFYHINEENSKAFACEGKVFEDTENNSFIVCGARFQHHSTLHIAMMYGDYSKCIDFASHYALAQGINTITCTLALENEELENALLIHHFRPEKNDLMTMEMKF